MPSRFNLILLSNHAARHQPVRRWATAVQHATTFFRSALTTTAFDTARLHEFVARPRFEIAPAQIPHFAQLFSDQL